MYKWALRFNYLWAFGCGIPVMIMGIKGLLGYDILIDIAEANFFLSIIMTLIGIILIIVGLYYSKDIEKYIREHNL